jgi:hypothetical protein
MPVPPHGHPDPVTLVSAPIHLGILMARPLGRPGAAPARRPEPAVTVRRLPATAPEVARLALLDGHDAPTGDWLVAEVGGSAVAAVPLSGAAPQPDPFGSDADRVVTLRGRAAAAQAATKAPSRLPQPLTAAPAAR